jgi:hypothetical protein
MSARIVLQKKPSRHIVKAAIPVYIYVKLDLRFIRSIVAL